MKNIAYILILLIGCSGLISCQSEQLPEEKGTGYIRFELSVDQEPEVIISRADVVADVDTFKVTIEKILIGEEEPEIYEFASYAALKEAGLLELEAGRKYRVRAESADVLNQQSEKPTYAGEDSTSITGGMVSVVTVECKRREVEIILDLSPLIEKGVTISKASIQLEGNDLHVFPVEGTGKTDSHFFAPDNELQLLLTGKYNGWDLGYFGGPHKIVDFIGEDNIKAHTRLVITVDVEPDSASPVSGVFSGFNLQIKAAR